jgi:hypothetical protein
MQVSNGTEKYVRKIFSCFDMKERIWISLQILIMTIKTPDDPVSEARKYGTGSGRIIPSPVQ